MKNQSFDSGKLSRRGFLGASSASLALMGFPVQAAISTGPGKGSEGAIPGDTRQQPPIFLTREGQPVATVVRPAEPSVLSRLAEERITGSVKRHASLVSHRLREARTYPASRRNLVVLGTPKSNPLVAKWVEEHPRKFSKRERRGTSSVRGKTPTEPVAYYWQPTRIREFFTGRHT